MSQPRNRYSSCCGTAFAPKVYPRICETCGNMFWDNPIPVAVVLQPVQRADGRVGLILIERGILPFIGGLALPGGFIEIEDWRTAGAREGEEEGVKDIDPSTLIPFSEFPYESTPDARRILMFMVAPTVREEDLPPFVPNKEARKRVLIYQPSESCFSIHTEAIRRFFSRF